MKLDERLPDLDGVYDRADAMAKVFYASFTDGLRARGYSSPLVTWDQMTQDNKEALRDAVADTFLASGSKP